MIAHSSGEWVSSEWPVCLVAETAAPHKMGAALTYARPYALFTLVGIAGEDDLDAPDLPVASSDGGRVPATTAGSPTNMNGHSVGTAGPRPFAPVSGSPRKPRVHSSKPILAPDASAQLRDQLLTELSGLAAAEDLIAWAHRTLSIKNTFSSPYKLVPVYQPVKLLDLIGNLATSTTSPRPTAPPGCNSAS
jgi:hypothetical protein